MLAVKGEVFRMFLLHVGPVKYRDVTVVANYGIDVVVCQVVLVHRSLDDVDFAALAQGEQAVQGFRCDGLDVADIDEDLGRHGLG